MINLILSQPIIPVTLGLALLLMAVAVALTLFNRWRADAPKRAKRRAVRLAKQAAEQKAKRAAKAARAVEADPEEEDAEAEEEEVAVEPVARQSKPKAATPAAPAAKGGMPSPEAAQALANALTSAPAETPKPGAQLESAAANQMQDILSSVFVDDEAMARYTVLLQGLDNIDISDLLALCQRVAGQLGIEPAVQKEQG